MNIDEKKLFAKKIIRLLKKRYPKAGTKLKFTTPFEMLAATILSAQCTDDRVNIVTETLFKKYKGIRDYANADLKVFEQDIRSTGFYHNKAKNVIGSAKMILDKYSGRVPDKMEELLALPGVARKTANVVMGNVYGKYEGIVVDTHVIRLSNRLGLTKENNPEKIERDLIEIVPRKDWFLFSHLFQALGRDACKAISPAHDNCVLKEICPAVL